MCSSYEIEPSENDLLEHMPLIKEAAVRDKEIAKSEVCISYLIYLYEGKMGAFSESVVYKRLSHVHYCLWFTWRSKASYSVYCKIQTSAKLSGVNDYIIGDFLFIF